MTTHENFKEYEKVKSGSDKNFCLTFSCFFFLISTYYYIYRNFIIWPLLISIVLLILAFTKSQVTSPFNRVWTKFSFILGKVMTPFIMAVLYFTIFLLIGMIFKILRRDMLKIKLENSAKTYWLPKEQSADQDRFTNQF